MVLATCPTLCLALMGVCNKTVHMQFATNSPPVVKHLLLKQPHGPWLKEVEIGARRTLRTLQKEYKSEYSETEMNYFNRFILWIVHIRTKLLIVTKDNRNLQNVCLG